MSDFEPLLAPSSRFAYKERPDGAIEFGRGCETKELDHLKIVAQKSSGEG